jgi:uncharacterized protein
VTPPAPQGASPDPAPDARPASLPGRTWEVTATALIVSAYGVARPALPAGARFVGNLAVAGVAVLASRRAGLSWTELGLSRDTTAPGVRVGALAGATVAAGVAGLAAVPRVRPFFADERVVAHSRRRSAWETTVRIPVETAWCEEVLFRGVVLGALGRHRSTAVAVAGSSLLFGLWHVPPEIDALGSSAAAEVAGSGAGGKALAVAGAVLGTTAAGAVLAGLRLSSGSVAAPALTHAALNVAGFSASRRVAGPGHRPGTLATG